MYLLIHFSKSSFTIALSELFVQVNIHDLYSRSDEKDYLYKSNQEEYFLNYISESLDRDNYKDVKAIIIDKGLGGSGWTRAIGLASHISCTEYSNCSLNNLPIVLTDWSDLEIEDTSLKDQPINNIFQTEGFYFRTYEDIFSIKRDNINGNSAYAIELEFKRLKPISIDKISIKIPYDNRHQTTNEWGAMRLASNFGVYDKIKFSYPKHIYFKYLSKFIKQKHPQQDTSLNNKFKKILLIDDNADCGWVELLEYVHKCPVDKKISTEEVVAWQNITPERFDEYDLIYLDLYLDKGNVNISNALSILKFIKGTFPHIPVVIFTASEKALNLDEVREKGADAMYIKESPLYFRNDEYSKNNYIDFKNTLIKIYDKYKILRPYWLLCRKILSHKAFRLIENSPRKLQDRIEERMRMFYGLLKKGYEQLDYDKQTFYYSDYELAFMTLWSVLNEIQEALYNKSNISILHSNGMSYSHHPDRSMTPLSKKQNWSLKNTGKQFVDNSISFTGSEIDGTPKRRNPGRYEIQDDISTSDLKYDNRNSPYYSIDTGGTFSSNEFVTKSLHTQIAYIILNRSSHTNIQLEFLFKLNEIRNSMYLTHGDSFDTSFFSSTEKVKRGGSTITPELKIKELFDLVAYLLTDDPSYLIVF